MADISQSVVIEFITDTSKLAPAVDQLEQIGKIEQGQAAAFKATNTEINKQADALKKVSAVNQQIDATGRITKKNVADLSTAVKGMSGTFQKEFKAGVIDGLKQAGVSIKDFEKQVGTSFGKTEQQTLSLRSQLRQMVEQLAQLKVQGKANSEEFRQLAADAGKLKDAMNDANQEVKNFASDTSTFDGLLSITSGLAGGFAVMQGATALFGDESEELQKTLLRVNAAMAILQGLQQVQIVLLKESAATKFLDTVATRGQSLALTAYNFVIGASTGLTKAFRIALASTGIGLVIILLYQLVTALRTKNDVQEKTNKLIDDENKLLDDNREALKRNNDERIAVAEAAGRSQSELLLAQEAANIREQNLINESNKKLEEQRAAIDLVIEKKKELFNSSNTNPFLSESKVIKEEVKAWNKLNEAIGKNNKELEKLQSDQRILQTKTGAATKEENKKDADDRKAQAKKAIEDAKRLAAERLQKAKEARAAEFQNFKAGIELELLAAEKGSDAELSIRKRLLDAEFQIDIDNEKLTNNERELLFQKFLKDRNDLDDQYQKERTKRTFENIQSGIEADLAALELSFEDKLRLTETAIRLQAQVEIAAAEGNAAKIIEIEAKRDKAIRDARIASIQEAVNYEIALAEAANGPGKRRLQAALENGELELNQRTDIIDELAILDSDAIQKRIDALNTERQQGLISQKDYNLQYAQLVDQQNVIWDDAEKKKTYETKKESQKRIEQFKQEVDNVLKVAEVVSDILSGIADIQSQRENEKIAGDKQRIKDLQDAGAITEKEAIARMKKIDAEERSIKQKQAKRDKDIALFNAIISTARGVAAAIPNPFLIALAIAIGAAQIAIIASKPIPKFAKGKKGSYQGLGLVGEAGSELVEKGGRMFVAEKPELVYLGSKDKVYSHKETVAMMSKPQMSRERNGVEISNNKGIQFDYKQMGEEVGKHVQQTINVDGVTQQVIKQKEFTKYLDGRRSF